ncbi:MAG: pyruvate ferredoxin oxidoreductase [Candidatus Schekmanbacteria bacterium]|nr:pyruvate ferredoxin oxidoreductase [Candidatus Schekmanbacteria bacterium]
MAKLVSMTGNQAVAECMRQINPDVVAAYPITPSTEIMQIFSEFVADGAVDTELVTVESEHSAMSACIGAAAAGGRVMTATSACGLALMWEMLPIASVMRLPIVMTVVNRALSAPINIHCDHSDSMGCRDSGWIQIYSENAQEVYHNVIQAIKISQREGVWLPIMVCVDGFIISHSIESIELLEDEKVKDFIGEFKPRLPLLDLDHPVTYGPLDLQDYYMEHKKQFDDALRNSKETVIEVAKEFKKEFGYDYGLIDKYKLDDAEVAIVVLNSAAGTGKHVVNKLREKGVKAGLLRIRLYRPFPYEEIRDALKNVKAVAVMDRAVSYGAQGPLFPEITAALYDSPSRPKLKNIIYGLGGRDISIEEIEDIFCSLDDVVRTGKVGNVYQWIGVREDNKR